MQLALADPALSAYSLSMKSTWHLKGRNAVYAMSVA